MTEKDMLPEGLYAPAEDLFWDDIWHKRRLLLKEGVDYITIPLHSWTIRIDPKEQDPKYKDIIEKALSEAEEYVAIVKPKVLWHIDCVIFQKKILKEKYGIDFKHYYELNPEFMRGALI